MGVVFFTVFAGIYRDWGQNSLRRCVWADREVGRVDVFLGASAAVVALWGSCGTPLSEFINRGISITLRSGLYSLAHSPWCFFPPILWRRRGVKGSTQARNE
ncbi:MAG: hypothetical protein CM15mP103_04190 [Gammaproteobacteria bacterium]|nr:MAG: hypothetical protein CM15mP103_04190 [Gammaproteobacteria bacterium]